MSAASGPDEHIDRPRSVYDRVLLIVAMEAEAGPIRTGLGLGGQTAARLHAAFPASIVISRDPGRVAVASNGSDPRFRVDSIASQPAVTTTLHAIERFRPDLVISAGTAGGFEARGGAIGDVVIADRVVFHDRRVSIPGFDRYGVGDYPVADLSAVATQLGLATGTVSTGNALDAPDVDLAGMAATEAVAKDMEAAAVAWVCEQVDVPFTAVKAITDLVDHHESAADQFARNLRMATANLADAVNEVVTALTV